MPNECTAKLSRADARKPEGHVRLVRLETTTTKLRMMCIVKGEGQHDRIGLRHVEQRSHRSEDDLQLLMQAAVAIYIALQNLPWTILFWKLSDD